MKYKFVNIVFVVLFVISSNRNVSFCQDVTLSQFFASGLYLNPALTGAHICPRIKLYHRNQWPSLPRAYITTKMLLDLYSFRIESGLGFSYTHDSQGEGMLQTHNLTFAYSKGVKLSDKWTGSAGLLGSYVFQYLDWSKLKFADQLDFEHGFVNPTSASPPDKNLRHYPDFGVGINFDYSKKFFGGIAVNHLTRPKIGFYGEANNRFSIKYSGYAGYIFIVEDSWRESDWEKNASITPVALFEIQGPFKQIIAGGYFSKIPFLAGVFVRHTFQNIDAVIVVFGFQQSQYALRYSFDVTTSPLTLISSGGGHELSFTWLFGCPDPVKKRIKSIKCPSFLK